MNGPRIRDRPPPVHAGHRPARACCTAASCGRTATAARSRRWTTRGAGDARRHDRARRRVRRRRGADRARGAPRRGRGQAPTWTPAPGQPSSDTIYEHLKTAAAPGAADVRHRRSQSATSRRRDCGARARSTRATAFPYIAHVPLEPRAAVAEWSGRQADGLVPARSGRSACASELATAFRIPEDRVRVIVPDTGSAYGGKHSGEHAIEAARLAKAAGNAGEAGVDPCRGVHVRLLPARRRHRHQGRRRCRAAGWSPGSSTTGTPARPAIRTPYDVPNQRIEFHPSRVAAPAGLLSRARRDRQPLCARDAHGRDRARARRRRRRVPAAGI